MDAVTQSSDDRLERAGTVWPFSEMRRRKEEREAAKVAALLAYVRGGRTNIYDRDSPSLGGIATMGDTIRIAWSGATGIVSIVGDDFVGADFGICYSENKHGDYEVIRRAKSV